jgi:hypothetical protein
MAIAFFTGIAFFTETAEITDSRLAEQASRSGGFIFVLFFLKIYYNIVI